MKILRSSIVWQLILPVPILLGLGIAAMWFWLPSQVAENTRDNATRNATQVVSQFKTLRGYYTKNVVKKILKNGGKASFNHKTESDSIPLPATVIHDMSELLSEEDTTLQLYSPFPFPNRNERTLDSFQESAWEFLNANPDQIYTRQEHRDGREVLRVAVADRMTAEVCVSCHNSRADTPKNDWNLGDVRGVLEVATVIDDQLAAGAALSNRVIVAGLIAGILLILATIFVGRRVSGPVAVMTAAMRRLADGDKTIEIEGRDRGDEIGAMAKAVLVFKENMIRAEQLTEEHRRTAEERAEADRAGAAAREQAAEEKAKVEAERAEETRSQQEEAKQRADHIMSLTTEFDEKAATILQTVNDAAGQLEHTAQSMTTTAEQTDQRSTAVAAAADEASANVQTVAASAEKLSSSIEEIARQVSQSTQITGRAVDEANRTNATVQGLADAAQKVGEVVVLISDIAEQTNLLALNATIEAARAGEAGKGFAVVASEVKSLANQTAKATEDIEAQISSMQAVTGEAVTAIDGIGSIIGEVSEIATAISEAVEEQGSATQEIARNVQQTATGTTEVSTNITGVNEAAKESGNASQEVMAAASRLSEESENLRTEVERFLMEIRAA